MHLLLLNFSPGNSARDKSNFYLVFTYCDYDLAGFLSHSAVKLTLEDVKILMKHLLMGLYKIHQTNILHRDMKAANVLVTNDGVLRLADFGLSRPILSKFRGKLFDFRFREFVQAELHEPGGDALVPTSRTAARLAPLRASDRHLGRGLHHGRALDADSDPARRDGAEAARAHPADVRRNQHDRVADCRDSAALRAHGTHGPSASGAA